MIARRLVRRRRTHLGREPALPISAPGPGLSGDGGAVRVTLAAPWCRGLDAPQRPRGRGARPSTRRRGGAAMACDPVRGAGRVGAGALVCGGRWPGAATRSARTGDRARRGHRQRSGGSSCARRSSIGVHRVRPGGGGAGEALPQPPATTTCPASARPSSALEIAYTVVPLVIVAVLFAMSQLVRAATSPRLSADPDLVVEVSGFQWQWQFHYPDDGIVVTGDPASTARAGAAGRPHGPVRARSPRRHPLVLGAASSSTSAT